MTVDTCINNDEINLDWINVDYMQNILNKHDKNVQVDSVKIESALGKGENYGGIISRVYVNYKVAENTSLKEGVFIIKSNFAGDEFFAETIKEYDIFNREMNLYEKILPKLTELMDEINDNDVLFPITEHVDYENDAIVFEDLNLKSFVMANRLARLDLKHTKLALKKLAKMHATSAVFNSRTYGSLEKFDRGFFNHYTNSYSPMFEGVLLACSNMIKEFGGDFLKYSEKLTKLRPHLMDYGREVFDITPNFLNVLNHGDYWTNNIMYKYNDINEPKDMVIIDFQYCCWGSPAIDLHYFLNTSIKEDLRILKYQEELIQYYHNILTTTLKALNFTGKIPSLQEFWVQLRAKEFYAFTSTCCTQPIMLSEKNDDADFHALMGLDERALNFKKSLFENKKVQNILKKMLPIFDSKGLIDIK